MYYTIYVQYVNTVCFPLGFGKRFKEHLEEIYNIVKIISVAPLKHISFCSFIINNVIFMAGLSHFKICLLFVI